MMPPNTGSTVIVFLISNSLFPQRKNRKPIYQMSTPLTKVFFLVSKIEREVMDLSMEREGIASGRLKGAKKESRCFKGNVS